ncbi:hypothetical protein FSP39_008011 [Pinctada imbricata]|uniref:DZIP3-like HEPN domain-containing protein n=1 Tax=Pinctada imbricata TaxID=66713 RepID=A0AA88YTL7_PINIB|nr:hypothetical protein FSP39_008011 [Pinctada imbricata]
MATTQYAPTSETTNAGRASRVLLGPCSDQLRDLLRHYVPPSTFSHVINKQKRKLPKLTKPQLDLIYPQSGPYTGDYSDFDISLLYTLLRNLCNIQKHNKGWGNDPDPNDMSLSANIERIRNCRNRLGHALDFSLSDLDFNDIWSSISTAVIEIDKVLKISHKYEKDIDYLKIATMDSEMAKYFEEVIRKQYTEDMEIKFLLSEHRKSSDQKLDGMAYILIIRISNIIDLHDNVNQRICFQIRKNNAVKKYPLNKHDRTLLINRYQLFFLINIPLIAESFFFKQILDRTRT